MKHKHHVSDSQPDYTREAHEEEKQCGLIVVCVKCFSLMRVFAKPQVKKAG